MANHKIMDQMKAFWNKNIATQPQKISTTEFSDSDRKSILEKQIIFHVSSGWRLDTQTEFAAVLSRGKGLNHILHLLLSLVTFGLWLIVWLMLLLVNRIHTMTIQIDKFGNTLINTKRS